MSGVLINYYQQNLTGWAPVTEAWTYASSTTITVPTGAASRFALGMKLRLDNTTTKYFYIVGIADTLLTVTGGSDYSVANSAITNIFISQGDNPVGFPAAFNYSPSTSAGGSMTYTGVSVLLAQFSINAGVVSYTVYIIGTIGGTPHNALFFNAPAPSSGMGALFAGLCYDGSYFTKYFGYTSGIGQNIKVFNADGTAWTAGANRTMACSGFYYLN